MCTTRESVFKCRNTYECRWNTRVRFALSNKQFCGLLVRNHGSIHMVIYTQVHMHAHFVLPYPCTTPHRSRFRHFHGSCAQSTSCHCVGSRSGSNVAHSRWNGTTNFPFKLPKIARTTARLRSSGRQLCWRGDWHMRSIIHYMLCPARPYKSPFKKPFILEKTIETSIIPTWPYLISRKL